MSEVIVADQSVLLPDVVSSSQLSVPLLIKCRIRLVNKVCACV